MLPHWQIKMMCHTYNFHIIKKMLYIGCPEEMAKRAKQIGTLLTSKEHIIERRYDKCQNAKKYCWEERRKRKLDWEKRKQLYFFYLV